MKSLKAGEYFGNHNHRIDLDGLIITDTEYIHSSVDWHYHENPYFTYLLQGKLLESNKTESYHLGQGSLLFHNWQDAHRNEKPKDFTRGFHVEMDRNWFLKYDLDVFNFEGSLHLENPLIKGLMNKLFIEFKIHDHYTQVTIDELLLEIFDKITSLQVSNHVKPSWVRQLQEMLIEEESLNYSLKEMGEKLNLHPVYLSRGFKRYTGTTIGNYARLMKLNKAFYLMISTRSSMTEIGYQSGFYDQSHFNLNFKKYYKKTPSTLRNKIYGC